MIGIVLWSDPEDQKAVFWCEDQGDLAYFDGSPEAGDVAATLHAGDMVQFSVTPERSMRLAHAPRLLHENVCAELPDVLRSSTPEEPAAQPSARILPFVAKPASNATAKTAARKA